MLVKEIMAKDLKWTTPEADLVSAAKLMKEEDCGSLPVIGSKTDRKPVGIITDRDIAIRAVAEGLDVTETTVEECMTPSTVTVEADTTLEECLQAMEENQIRRIIVVDDAGACIGIVSQAQIALNIPSRMAGELLQEISR